MYFVVIKYLFGIIRLNIFLFLLFRYGLFKDIIERIENGEQSLYNFSKGYENFGIHINDDNSVNVREWAPGAQELFLTGDFSEY